MQLTQMETSEEGFGFQLMTGKEFDRDDLESSIRYYNEAKHDNRGQGITVLRQQEQRIRIKRVSLLRMNGLSERPLAKHTVHHTIQIVLTRRLFVLNR